MVLCGWAGPLFVGLWLGWQGGLGQVGWAGGQEGQSHGLSHWEMGTARPVSVGSGKRFESVGNVFDVENMILDFNFKNLTK